MKFTVTMKDPDTLGDAISDAIKAELDEMPGLPDDEAEEVADMRREKVAKLCSKWFEYGEYLRVEIDTEAGTCVVLENK
jgi:hypothetical protein